MSENDIGKKIFLKRKALRLTLEEVGQAVGVSKSTVQRWENGYIKNMGRDKIAVLAKILQMDPIEFVPGSEEIKPLPKITIKPRGHRITNAYIKAIVKNPNDRSKTAYINVIPKKIDPGFDSLVKQWEVATPKVREEAIRYIEYLNTTKR